VVTAVFRADSLTYRYPDGRLGLAEASVTVAPGESVVVVGANATGKSTLLHLLAGLVFPTGGAVEGFGTPLTEAALERGEFARSFRQRVGVLFQDTDAMLFNATVYDEIAFGPLQLDLPPEEVRRRVGEMMDLLGLRPIAQQPPHALSGGEKKKVAFAALLATSPEVLLLDEPTAGLDPRFQRWFVELALELRHLGKSLVTATHDLHIADEIGDRLIILGEDHRIAAAGPPRRILCDLDLLLSVNLVHEHAHIHDGEIHIHPHAHLHAHEHDQA
jgi:cobalt/nickel transport system ATP-binding protein